MEWVLEEFGDALSLPLPDNNNFPPELPADRDPATLEWERTDNGAYPGLGTLGG